MVLVSVAGGVVAAAVSLSLCAATGVLGWFVADAGAHGTSTDGIRVGALAWLLAHGSGLVIGGVSVTAIPLGLTLGCLWTVWRSARRVGERVSGHGPDADRIADGERDWTVPTAASLFAAGYLLVAVPTAVMASGTDVEVPAPAAVLGALVVSMGVSAAGIAVGSGRAAIWIGRVPPVLGRLLTGAWSVFGWCTAVSAAVFVVAFVADLGTAANLVSQAGRDTGDAVWYAVLSTAAIPNATWWTTAYLLGPGFVVGTGTVVTTQVVVLGPLPLVPLLAALPEPGPAPSWVAYLTVLPGLTAALASGRQQWRRRTDRFEVAALTGAGSGILAAIVVTLAAAVSGGSIGPGRMASMGPSGAAVLWHAVAVIGGGALLGAVVVAGWHRYRPVAAARLRRGSR